MSFVASRSYGPREWVTCVVQWNKARNTLKYGAHAYAGARGQWLRARGATPQIGNIFTASSPKAGSQWMKALFNHPVVRRHTGLFTLPQLDYQTTPDRVFPAGTFVPGIYCSYEEYLRMPRTRERRVVYMLRDPRDVIVSGYHSTVKTHRKLDDRELEAYRDKLRAMPFDDALSDLIRVAAPRLHEAASWADADDPDVALFRLEEVSTDPRPHVDAMLRHCGVDLSADELEIVLNDVSRDALQARDLALRGGGSDSHYRTERTTYLDVFKPQHYEAMDRYAPGVAELMGYPSAHSTLQ